MSCSDLVLRRQVITTTVDHVSGRVAVKLGSCPKTLVFRPTELQRFRQHLAEAFAVLIAENGDWVTDEDR